ncbi:MULTISPECIES: hypothetical protein [Providencia]|uniref:Uncharacterized protein n=1 Tax=Providencia heimbachae ATCC 35613 TaxID=1354272 RepID=A0A1B7K2X5_9GAMM|nr:MULTISPECIES: hypothetical protein [Providencia]MBP6121165.1 hypothetical protein [Providencia sp.]NIH22941.1 hypothetical protein [Providencia heimbachae]OAT54485.1 hypothetical protein M998_0476 [Providencia heimbachae ATCC 35613]SQH13535.1 Uncharacterised protein [Providencia heimbachae]
MLAINPIDILSYTLASTIKMVITPIESIFQSGVIGDIIFIALISMK